MPGAPDNSIQPPCRAWAAVPPRPGLSGGSRLLRAGYGAGAWLASSEPARPSAAAAALGGSVAPGGLLLRRGSSPLQQQGGSAVCHRATRVQNFRLQCRHIQGGFLIGAARQATILLSVRGNRRCGNQRLFVSLAQHPEFEADLSR